jgi:OOP family OmpA-OmpF porin
MHVILKTYLIENLSTMKNARTVFLALCAFAVLNMTGSKALAQDGLYIGGSAGPSFVNTSITEVDWENVTIDGNDFGYKLYAGYQLPAFLAFEAGYRHLGKVSDAVAEHNSYGWDLNAKVNLNLGPMQLFGKAGAFLNNVEVTFADPLRPDINEHNTRLMFGFGAGLNIDRVGFRAEWESLDLLEDQRVSMLTAGVTFRLAGGY